MKMISFKDAGINTTIYYILGNMHFVFFSHTKKKNERKERGKKNEKWGFFVNTQTFSFAIISSAGYGNLCLHM